MFKIYRLRRKYTQEYLAELTNLDTRTIQRIENEQRMPSIETLAKLAKVLQISDEDLLKYIKEFPIKNK